MANAAQSDDQGTQGKGMSESRQAKRPGANRAGGEVTHEQRDETRWNSWP